MNSDELTPARTVTDSPGPEILRRLWPLLCLVAIIVLIGLFAELAPTVVQRRITQGLIYLVAVVGLYVFVGNSGVLAFGNVAFMAIGAYVSALLTMSAGAKGIFLPDLPVWLQTAEWAPLTAAVAGGGPICGNCAKTSQPVIPRLKRFKTAVAVLKSMIVRSFPSTISVRSAGLESRVSSVPRSFSPAHRSTAG